MEKQVHIRVSEEQIAAWREAAHIRRTSLSDWARKVLSATAEQTRKENK